MFWNMILNTNSASPKLVKLRPYRKDMILISLSIVYPCIDSIGFFLLLLSVLTS